MVPSMGSGGGASTGDDQESGLEQEIMMSSRKGLDPHNMLAPKAALVTKEEPNSFPSITQLIVGHICDENNSAVIWVLATQRQDSEMP